MKVAGNDHLSWSYLPHLAELVFGREGLVLTGLLKYSKHELFVELEIIDEYCLLVSISIPVLGLVFVVGVWESLKDPPGLSDARCPVDPLVVEDR